MNLLIEKAESAVVQGIKFKYINVNKNICLEVMQFWKKRIELWISI
jgi:predicted nucleotidyltransferase